MSNDRPEIANGNFELSDVYDLLSNVYEKHVNSVDTPDGQSVRVRFDDPDAYGETWCLEVNLHGPSVWLHHYDDDRNRTQVWKNKCRR